MTKLEYDKSAASDDEACLKNLITLEDEFDSVKGLNLIWESFIDFSQLKTIQVEQSVQHLLEQVEEC